MMETENERQWLVKYLPPDLFGCDHIFIRQGYLSIADGGHEHRIRKEEEGEKAADFFSIIKAGTGRKRRESKLMIGEAIFDRLWPLTEGRRVWKTRYRVPYGEVMIELDIYWRRLGGLVVAEVEFFSDEQAFGFTPPGWFGREVTRDRRYSDQHLAVYGKPAEIRFLPLSGGAPVLNLETGVKKLAEVIRLDRRKRRGGSTIVLVGGGSSTGKTEKVVKEAAKILDCRGITWTVISADDYNQGKKWKDAEAARGKFLTWDDPEIYDYRELFRADLPRVLSGLPIAKRIFDFITCEPARAGVISPADVVFIEGLHVLSGEWADFGHIRVFAETSMHGRMIRRLLRDTGRTGREPEQILKLFLGTVEPKHREFVEPTRKNADIVIVNEYVPEAEAGRCAARGRQMKFRTAHTRDLAAAAGAAGTKDMIYQKDHYFCPSGRDLGRTGESVRIRDDNGVKIMTYKGPKRITGGWDETPVLTVGLDEEAEKIFRAFYGKEAVTVIKFRAAYRLDGIDFFFDSQVVKVIGGRTVLLGNFVEIVAAREEDAEALTKVLGKLWLKPADLMRASYAEMQKE